MTPTPAQPVKTVIPDLAAIPLDELAGLGGSALAHAIALYRERLARQGILVGSFNSSI